MTHVKEIHQGGQVQVRRYDCGREVTSHPTQMKIRDRLHYKLCDMCMNFAIDRSEAPHVYTKNINSSRRVGIKNNLCDNI